jgi:hypothetical protein
MRRLSDIRHVAAAGLEAQTSQALDVVEQRAVVALNQRRDPQRELGHLAEKREDNSACTCQLPRLQCGCHDAVVPLTRFGPPTQSGLACSAAPVYRQCTDALVPESLLALLLRQGPVLLLQLLYEQLDALQLRCGRQQRGRRGPRGCGGTHLAQSLDRCLSVSELRATTGRRLDSTASGGEGGTPRELERARWEAEMRHGGREPDER